MEVKVTFEGDKDLIRSLQRMAREEPDIARKALRKTSKKFMKDSKNLFNKEIDPRYLDKNNEQSISRSWRITNVIGVGSMIHCHIKNSAPHFHLVELGHDVVNRFGVILWHKDGRHLLDQIKDSRDWMQEIGDEIIQKVKEAYEK